MRKTSKHSLNQSHEVSTYTFHSQFKLTLYNINYGDTSKTHKENPAKLNDRTPNMNTLHSTSGMNKLYIAEI
jgi:hypothetical protein